MAIFKAKSLNPDDLDRLLNDEIHILQIENYCTPAFISDFLTRVQTIKTESYQHEIERDGKKAYIYYGVDRIGLPFNTTYDQSPDFKEKY